MYLVTEKSDLCTTAERRLYTDVVCMCDRQYVPAKPSILAGAGTSDQVALGLKCDVVAADEPGARVEFVLLVG